MPLTMPWKAKDVFQTTQMPTLVFINSLQILTGKKTAPTGILPVSMNKGTLVSITRSAEDQLSDDSDFSQQLCDSYTELPRKLEDWLPRIAINRPSVWPSVEQALLGPFRRTGFVMY